MFTAIDENGVKIDIANAEKGRNYVCPFCNGKVRVKHNEINPQRRKHFAHEAKCLDSWEHDMSEWHYNWQSKFPIECREYVMEKDGVKHRADVFVEACNCVIEFQHSRISREDFEERNRFYKSCGHDIVWIFDAKGKIVFEDDQPVWKVANDLFSEMQYPPDSVYLQSIYDILPEALVFLSEYNEKPIKIVRTFFPIMPNNILKQFGVITDNKVSSVNDLIIRGVQPVTSITKRPMASPYRGPREQYLFRGDNGNMYPVKPKSGKKSYIKPKKR